MRLLTRRERRLAGIRALLTGALVLFGVLLLPGTALASYQSPAHTAIRASAPLPNSILPSEHRCANFGTTNSAGYRAGHCADIETFINSIGLRATRGRGQAFCQSASTGTIVRCAGISQKISISNAVTGETASSNAVCGRYGGSACPAGRFQHYSPGIYVHCGSIYYATVRTTIVLPVRATTSRSFDLESGLARLAC